MIRSICHFKREVRAGRLRVIKKKTDYNDVKEMKDESGGKKVDQF